ncbi:dermonecrotic toxin domain-containing protein [Pseudomonas sp. LB3P31]
MPEIDITPSSENVLTQLITGPLIREVAATVLSPALNALYPRLKIDPMLAMVVTPTWIDTGSEVIPGDYLFESLTDVLVRLGLSGMTVTFIDGEHFLTLQPGSEPPAQLPVKINAIGSLVNALAPQLFLAYQQQQLDYWNQLTSAENPRWHELSKALQDVWGHNGPTDWDADQKAMALAVFDQPDRATRRPQDKYLTKACLIDTERVEDAMSAHLRVLDIAVFVGTLGSRTLVLAHSITDGFSRYDSVAALGAKLFNNPGRSTSKLTLQWRLFEPEGNFFHHQACALIALEAEAIAAFDAYLNAGSIKLSPQVSAAAKSFAEFEALPSSRFNKVQGLLTDWMKNASSAELTRYSRHLMDLAQLREQDAGKTFDEGIPSLAEFALQTLQEQMVKDYPAAADLDLRDIQISIASILVLGAVVIPKTQTVTLSLVDLALQNLIAEPLGNKSVQYKNGASVPGWMTPAYLEQLVTQVDIGAVYPALIKRKLLDDSRETLRRQALYLRNLRVQLPLQALQHKMRGEFGIDERGYQYVIACMRESDSSRLVDGQEIIIRPLAFVTGDRADGKGDEVANMFIIGPRATDQGPCLLYRPLLVPSLLQYPAEANLLYALKHAKPLRQSILAWLDDDVRFNYSQYVFCGELPSAWTLTQLLVDPTSALGKMGSVSLSSTALDDASLAPLFKANANAMITLADRQSVSNAQARWETLKHGAWMLFNVALPFLGRTAGVAAWIWQIMDDLQEITDAAESGDSQPAWSALTDLLLTLGMVLAHRAASRHKPLARVVEKIPPPITPDIKPEHAIKVTHAADLDQLPRSHETSLHATAALPTSSLGTLLDELAIAEPKGMAAASTAVGPYQHLGSLSGKWYAKVGLRWFEVTLNANHDVQIIDSRQAPTRTGPLLVKNAQGEWFIDTRLRLRGGGREKQRLEQQNRQRQAELKEQMTEFERLENSRETELKEAQAKAQAPGAWRHCRPSPPVPGNARFADVIHQHQH